MLNVVRFIVVCIICILLLSQVERFYEDGYWLIATFISYMCIFVYVVCYQPGKTHASLHAYFVLLNRLEAMARHVNVVM